MKISLPKGVSFDFVLTIGITYFLQGFRAYVFNEGIIWFYSNHFHLDPGPTQYYMSVILMTWNIKFLYGLIFDNFPILKKHDRPYMFISVIISTVGFFGLRYPFLSNTPASTCFWFFLALMGMAMSDVIADAMVVKHAKKAGKARGAHLQTFCWMMSSVGSFIGRPIAGTINGNDGSGSRVLLGSVYLWSGVVNLVVCFFLKEEAGEVMGSCMRTFSQLKKLFVAIFLNQKVLVPISCIVLSSAIVNAAMNFWKKETIGVGATMKSYIDTAGDVTAILGLSLYSRFYTKTSYRTIFFWTQLICAIFASSDLILVKRWNIAWRIPDVVFLVGSQTIINTLYSLQGMPFLVMAAQLCPAEIEATFYAAMMSLSNLGGTFSSLWGGILMEAFHIVKKPTTNSNSTMDSLNFTNSNVSSSLINITNSNMSFNSSSSLYSTAGEDVEYDFSNLAYVLWIRIFTMFLPAILVLLMIPDTNNVGDEDGSGEEIIDFQKLSVDDRPNLSAAMEMSDLIKPVDQTHQTFDDIDFEDMDSLPLLKTRG